MFRFQVAWLTVIVALGQAGSLPYGASVWGQAPGKKDGGLADDEVRRVLLGLAPVPLQHKQPIDAVTFAADGKSVITVSNHAGKVFHWDASSGKLLREWGMPQGQFYTSALSTNGKVLAATDGGGLVSLWDGTTGKRLHILKDATGPSLAVSPDGKSVVSGLQDGALGVWDVASGKLRGRLPKSHWSLNQALAFSPDGRRIAASRADATVGIWDAANAKEVGSLPVGTADVRLVTFNPSGTGLASVTGFGEVKLWDLATAKSRREMQLPVGHRLTCGFFTPDGRTLVTGGDDHKVRIMEIASGRERHCFPAVPDLVTAAALAPDGRSLVIGAGDQVALVRLVSGNSVAEGQLMRAAPPKDAAAAWADLAHTDPARAYRAIAALADQPKAALALLQKELRPAAAVDRGKIAQLIKNLDNEKFAVRQRATKELQELHESAEEELQAALGDNPTAESRQRLQALLGRLRSSWPAGRLRTLRATEVLEMIATPEARKILESLASGAADDALTQDARAALRRLERGQGKQK